MIVLATVAVAARIMKIMHLVNIPSTVGTGTASSARAQRRDFYRRRERDKVRRGMRHILYIPRVLPRFSGQDRVSCARHM